MPIVKCAITSCIYNDGTGECNKDEIYVSDEENGEPMCMDMQEE